jgi:hypothetical protein
VIPLHSGLVLTRGAPPNRWLWSRTPLRRLQARRRHHPWAAAPRPITSAEVALSRSSTARRTSPARSFAATRHRWAAVPSTPTAPRLASTSPGASSRPTAPARTGAGRCCSAAVPSPTSRSPGSRTTAAPLAPRRSIAGARAREAAAPVSSRCHTRVCAP